MKNNDSDVAKKAGGMPPAFFAAFFAIAEIFGHIEIKRRKAGVTRSALELRPIEKKIIHINGTRI